MDSGYSLLFFSLLLVQRHGINDAWIATESISCTYRYQYYWYWLNDIYTWSSWSSCDHSCGGGVRFRKRCNIQTDNLETEQSACGQTCFHYGTFINGKCKCNAGASGRCCEVMPVCQPSCENGGSCIGTDMCQCSKGYYGKRCEIGGSFNERFLPKLHSALPVNILHKQLSWYDSPNHDRGNEVCYIKIHIQNAAYDTILTAESVSVNEPNNPFGNFTAAPIHSQAAMNGSSRFACLEIRCPGTFMSGQEFDVQVKVSVETRYSHCNASHQGRKPLHMNITSSADESDSLTVILENGKKYGPLYGVYVYTEYREKAQYLAQHACYSGHDYDYDHFLPTNGILARYNC